MHACDVFILTIADAVQFKASPEILSLHNSISFYQQYKQLSLVFISMDRDRKIREVTITSYVSQSSDILKMIVSNSHK